MNNKKLQDVLNSNISMITLLETDPKDAFEKSMQVIKHLTKKKFSGVILSLNRPYKNLIEAYAKNKINTKKIIVIDCVSKKIGMQNENPESVIYLDGPSDLTNMSIGVTEAAEALGGKLFVLVDSLSTLLIHNNETTLARFIHVLFTRLRIKNITGIVTISKETHNKEFRAEIVQLCDTTQVL